MGAIYSRICRTFLFHVVCVCGMCGGLDDQLTNVALTLSRFHPGWMCISRGGKCGVFLSKSGTHTDFQGRSTMSCETPFHADLQWSVIFVCFVKASCDWCMLFLFIQPCEGVPQNYVQPRAPLRRRWMLESRKIFVAYRVGRGLASFVLNIGIGWRRMVS